MAEEHCAGRSLAWGARFRGEPHLLHKLNPRCDKCDADMGCERCSGPHYELFCRHCRDWANSAALARHGRQFGTEQERREGIKFLRAALEGLKGER